MINEFEVALHK